MKIIFTFFLFFIFLFLNAQPIIEWQNNYGGTSDDFGPVVLKTTDGGLFIAVSSNSNDNNIIGNHGFYDICVVKTNSSGDIEWQKCYGGSLSEFVNKMIQCSDGNFILVGSAQSIDGDITGNKGNADVCILKINTSGDIVWQKTYGGSDNETGNNIIETADGNLWIIGQTESYDGDATLSYGSTDIWLLKLSSNGNLLWQKNFGGSADDYGKAIAEVDSNNFIIAGYTYSNDHDILSHYGSTQNCDFIAIKINSTGNVIWSKNFGGNENDNLSGMIKMNDKGFLLYGISASDNGNLTENKGYLDGWMIKINSEGNVQWQKSVGGSEDDYLYSIVQNSDGSLFAVGSTLSSDGDITTAAKGDHDAWMFKLNSSGPVQWSTTFGGTLVDDANSVTFMEDGTAVVASSTTSSDGDVTANFGMLDLWLVKMSNLSSIKNISELNNEIILYPNPAKDEVQIAFPFSNMNIEISVLTIDGKIILQKNILQTKIETIDITGISAGIYWLRIFTKEKNIYKKLTVF